MSLITKRTAALTAMTVGVFGACGLLQARIADVGGATLATGVLLNVSVGLAFLVALAALFQRRFLRPLEALAEHTRRVVQGDESQTPFGGERGDALGELGEGVEQLSMKLQKAHRALTETARTAGMSEIATGILHNVGNVLNSVNISASLVSQRIDGLCIDDLERLAEVLEEHQGDLPRFLVDDPRGQHIQPFLSALVVQLGEEQRSIRGEVASLADGIDHICELIKSQQSLAKGTRVLEPTNLPERMDEALRITQRVQGVDPELVVVRRFEDLVDVNLDKHKLLEILVNLVQNARQAMHGVNGTRELLLELKSLGDERISIAVEDSGVGIASEDLEQVFSMGFTTREDGHGFGLHSSANAAKEMGGVLRAESQGPGRGARFVLELPMTPPGQRPEAAAAAETAGGAA